MTVKELTFKMNAEFGFKDWPSVYFVDAETYGYVCQSILDHHLKTQYPEDSRAYTHKLAVGPNNGVLFKNVELILEGQDESE